MLPKKELKAALKIDLNDLSEECSKQSVFFSDAAEQASIARIKARAAKHKYEECLKFAELEIRQGKRDTKGVKLTESAILALAAIDESVLDARSKQLEAEKDALSWDSLVSGFEQKRSMLSNEVSLFVTGYFQTGEIKDRRQLIEKQIDEVRKVRASRL